MLVSREGTRVGGSKRCLLFGVRLDCGRGPVGTPATLSPLASTIKTKMEEGRRGVLEAVLRVTRACEDRLWALAGHVEGGWKPDDDNVRVFNGGAGAGGTWVFVLREVSVKMLRILGSTGVRIQYTYYRVK